MRGDQPVQKYERITCVCDLQTLDSPRSNRSPLAAPFVCVASQIETRMPQSEIGDAALV